MAVDVGSAVGYLDLDINGFLNGLKNAQEQANSMAQGIGSSLEGVGSSLTSAGTKWTAAISAPLASLGGLAVKTTADFESQMSKVSAISGAVGDDLEALKAKAKEMGETTKFSASESAEAFQYMAMAGWKTEDMLDGISGIMNLAAADGLDLATTSDIVTDALTAFGLSASDSGHFADVLAKASSSANTNVSMLGESFKYVAPVAGALGYSVEDVSVALGLMANSGIKASQGGTALRGTISRLIKPTDKIADAMMKYGITIADASGNVKPLSQLMDELRVIFADLTEEEKGQLAATLAGQTGMSGLLAIVNASEKDYNDLTQSINNANGTAQNMADTLNNNLNGQLTLLKSQLEGIAISFGEILLPIIKQAVDRLSSLADWVANLNNNQREMILQIAAVVIAIGPLLVVIGKIITKVGNAINTFVKLANFISSTLIPKISAISAPALAIVAVIGVLVAAFVTLWNTNDDFRKKIIKLWNELKETFSQFINDFISKVKALWEEVKPLVGYAIAILKKIWEEFCNFLAPIFEGVFKEVINIFNYTKETILNILDIFIGLFSGNWEQCLLGVKAIFEDAWTFIKNTFSTVLGTLKNIADVFFGWFGTSWDEVWGTIKNVFVNIWNQIINVFSGITDNFSGLLNSIKHAFSEAWDVIRIIWDAVAPFFENVWKFIKGTFAEVPGVLSDYFSKAWEIIKNVWNAVAPFFDFLWKAIKTIFEPVINFFKTIFENAWIAIKTVFKTTVDFFQLLWDAIALVFSVVKGVLTGDFRDALEGIKQVWNTVVKFFSDIWEGIKGVFVNVGLFFWDTFKWGFENIKAVLSGLVGHFEWLWNGIKAVFSGVASFFSDAFSKGVNAIKDVFSSIGDFFSGVWETVSNKAADGMNWIMEKIENGINHIIDGLNWFGFDLPDIMGGGHVGFDLNYVSLPRLEQGGILKKGQVGLLEGNGTEAVIPLEKNLGWIKEIAKGITEYIAIDITPLVAIMDAYKEISRGMLVSVNSTMQKQTEVIERLSDARPEAPIGNTYNFYSPKPIDEYEAARQMEKAERDLAEGYYV